MGACNQAPLPSYGCTKPPSPPMSSPEDALSPSSAGKKRAMRNGVSRFISELYVMVCDSRNKSLISWNPGGTSFLVCNETEFAHEILPEHFKHGNFSSFVRQLNMYGFRKVNRTCRNQMGIVENEICEFSHPNFKRGRPDLLNGIKRKTLDSESLRRETGEIHTSFAMTQSSQSDLFHQFKALQDSFANLARKFEETKKVQFQQQVLIRRLAERQDVQVPSTLIGFENEGIVRRQSAMFFTNSALGDSSWPTMPFQQDLDTEPSYPFHQNDAHPQSTTFYSSLCDNPLSTRPAQNILLSSLYGTSQII